MHKMGKMAQLRASRGLPSRLVLRYLAVFFGVGFVIANYMLWQDTKSWDAAHLHAGAAVGHKHPIRKLMIDAKIRHEQLYAKRSEDLFSAASRYRARRHRQPPPGFEEWMDGALKVKAIIVEEYFDRIYKDLMPYWALDPEMLAKRANSWHWVVRVRNGTASYSGDVEGRVPWLQLWTDLINEFAKDLPDLDMPINYMDEPRLLVPFDEISKLVHKALRSRQMTPLRDVTSKYRGLAHLDAEPHKPYDPEWIEGSTTQPYWDLAVKACGPESPAYGVSSVSVFSGAPAFPRDWTAEYAYKGFVQNWTAAMDPCLQPHLRQLHGSFVEPLSMSSTDELIPLFGGSKTPMNNEILIPGAMYLSDDTFYSGGDSLGTSWAKKKNALIWRGDASGGRARADTWRHFHRHRLVEMLNGTAVSNVERDGVMPHTFTMPSSALYESEHRRRGDLGKWLSGMSDAAFTHNCITKDCKYIAPYYREVDRIPMEKQYQYKYLPDADGNSYSARFRGFMRSTSLPLKATVYAEWHDDRLAPWVHFVPLDNTFQDLYSVLEYFADGDGPGDHAASLIAERGSEWASRALRREDMMIYMWRLLIEWARVCDENRDTLGWVGDLPH